MSDADLDDYERKIVGNVEEHGWHATYVFDPKNEAPAFLYSVGFAQTLRCPEFIVFGLGNDMMHSMLWEIFRQIEKGKVPEDNQRWTGLLEGFACVSRVVHPTNIIRDYLNSAMWFRKRILERDDILPAFQIVWPGARDGLFPWDDGCAQIVRDCQPPLYLPNRSLS